MNLGDIDFADTEKPIIAVMSRLADSNRTLNTAGHISIRRGRHRLMRTLRRKQRRPRRRRKSKWYRSTCLSRPVPESLSSVKEGF